MGKQRSVAASIIGGMSLLWVWADGVAICSYGEKLVKLLIILWVGGID